MSSEISTEDRLYGLGPYLAAGTLAIVVLGVTVALPAEPAAAAAVMAVMAVAAAGLVGLAVHRTIRPLSAGDVENATPMSGRDRMAIEQDKQIVLRAIKELEFDRAMGKLADTDFEEMSNRLRARVAVLMRRLEEVASDEHEAIERELRARIAKRRVANRTPRPADPTGGRIARGQMVKEARQERGAPDLTPPRCAGCGTANDLDARFCKGCGMRF